MNTSFKAVHRTTVSAAADVTLAALLLTATGISILSSMGPGGWRLDYDSDLQRGGERTRRRESPVAVAYVPGRDLDYYIAASGGVNRKGNARHAYVTQPNGKVESRRGRGVTPRPQPGRQVVVPEKDPADRRDYVSMLPALASALGSLVVIVVTLAR